MKRLARRIALEAAAHGFVIVYRVGGRRASQWFTLYVEPKVDRLIAANLRDYQRSAFKGVSGA